MASMRLSFRLRLPVLLIAITACSPSTCSAFVISGTVVGPDKQPVTGATVAVRLQAPLSDLLGGDRAWPTGTTDANGHFRLDADVAKNAVAGSLAPHRGYAISVTGAHHSNWDLSLTRGALHAPRNR